jgi:hypothetical protein
MTDLDKKEVVACPKCYKRVNPVREFKHTKRGSYFSTISCGQCGYSGLPIQVTEKEYEKLVKSK